MLDLTDSGTPDYQAPEPPPGTEKADVWSLGATIHAMAHNGKPPIATPPAAVAKDKRLLAEFARQPHNKLPRSFDGTYSLQL